MVHARSIKYRYSCEIGFPPAVSNTEFLGHDAELIVFLGTLRSYGPKLAVDAGRLRRPLQDPITLS